MSANSDDLISLWLAKHSSNKETENPTDLLVRKDAAHKVNNAHEPDQNASPIAASIKPDNRKAPDTPDNPNRPKPMLSGRIAEYLSKQKPRALTKSEPLRTEDPAAWSTDDLQTKSVLAMSLVLTSHLIRFAGTTLSENHLNAARDEILHRFKAKDAVKIEVEAYDLLNWFANAMNENWQPETPEIMDNPQGETSEAAILFIIAEAIRYGHDLNMRYYTGSRGQFTERRITPIEVTAEKYLIAYCHLREEERVFRLSRIVQLSPVAADGQELQSTLCYPNVKDTMLPPLPATPSVEMRPVAVNRKKATSPKSSNPAQNTPAGKNNPSESHAKAAGKRKNNDSTRQPKTSQTPSLFDFDNTKTKKTAPKKNSQERSLFD